MRDWLEISREREAAAHRDLYARRRAEGLCAKCGDKRDLPGVICSTCRGRMRDYREREKAAQS